MKKPSYFIFIFYQKASQNYFIRLEFEEINILSYNFDRTHLET